MEAKHRLIAIRFPDGLPETEPLCIVQQSTFDQARGSMRELYEFFIQNHENVGLELYGRVNGKELTPSAQRLNELLDQMNDTIAAMEATHEHN